MKCKSFRRRLLATKLIACLLSFGYAYPYFPFNTFDSINFLTAMFGAALVSLWPRIGWSIPCLVIGFCLSPVLFALRVNGSFAEDLTAAIVGAIFGLVIGLGLDVYAIGLDKKFRQDSRWFP